MFKVLYGDIILTEGDLLMDMNNDLTWLKLDNAALIYPALLSKKIAPMFRLSVSLKENIDLNTLNMALIHIMNRFPTFNFQLKEGLFWCYFDKINNKPIITGDYNNPLLRINFKDNKYYMFRTRVYKNRIAVEIFHSLTDGTGGLTFLLTLTAEYLKLKYKIKIKYNDLILNPNDKPNEEEYQDSFFRYASKNGKLEKNHKAYHIKGIKEEDHLLNIITGKINISKLKRISKQYNATITEFITAIMIDSLYKISSKNNNRKPIMISIPINLRKIYYTKTLRNFSSYVNVGIKPTEKGYSLQDIINSIQKQMKDLTKEEVVNSKISANVALERNIFIRIIPMFIKKHIMAYVGTKKGDNYITTTFSNLGLVDLPEQMSEYVTDFNFILGKSKITSGSVSAIGYKNTLYITFSRKIKESEFERIFFTTLVNMGLKVEIESNR